MKISELIATHHAILQKARLAATAQAYVVLRRLAERVRHASLHGLVNLRQPDVAEGRLWASLTALEGHQSVLEEHFSEEDLMEFADAMAYVRDCPESGITFKIETLMAGFVVTLGTELSQAGVILDFEEEGVSGADESFRCQHPSGPPPTRNS